MFQVSRIYVGGIPAGVKVDDALMSRRYYGQLEDLRINNRPIGLFNFMTNGTTNIAASKGAKERYLHFNFFTELSKFEI